MEGISEQEDADDMASGFGQLTATSNANQNFQHPDASNTAATPETEPVNMEAISEQEDADDMASGFGQLSATSKFLIGAGYSHEEAIRYLETQSVLLTIKTITCSICLEEDIQPGDGIIIKNCLHMVCR